MDNNAFFGRPRPSDRLQLWWETRTTTWRMNALLFAVVGSLSLGLVLAAVSRDATRTAGVATAGRPGSTVAGPVTVPVSGLKANAAGPAAAPGDQSSTTTTPGTIPTSAAPGAVTGGDSSPGPTVASSSPGGARTPAVATTVPTPATTVPTTGVIYTDAPAPTLPPQTWPVTTATTLPATSVPPTSATTAPPTTPPPTTPTTRPPSPTTAPPAPTTPTTSSGRLSLPFDLPLFDD